MAGPSKNPFINITLGSAVMGVLGYLTTHIDPTHAPLIASGLGIVSYFLAGLFHRNPPQS